MRELTRQLLRWSERLPRGLGHVVEVQRGDTPAQRRRRRWISAATLVAGTGMLGASLSTQPGSRRFYGLTFATAATWVVGGALSGPLHLGWIENRGRELNRPVVVPVATGAGVFAIFCAGILVVRKVPRLDRAVANALDFAEGGREPLVLLTTCANGLGEEVFFRGALYAALPQAHPVVGSTAAYTLTTVATRNPALVLAAALMGTLFGYQRRATGGLQAPLLTHLTWSTLMVAALPAVFRRAHRRTLRSAS